MNKREIIARVLAKTSEEKLNQILKILEPHLQIWKTIEVGIHSGKYSFIVNLDRVCTVSDWAQDIIGQNAFVVSSVRQAVELVKASVGEMGFTKLTPYKEIQAWGNSHDLDPARCEDAGYYIREHGKDHAMGQSVYFAMDSIADSDRDPSILKVYRDDDGLHLIGGSGEPGNLCGPDGVFVFRRRR